MYRVCDSSSWALPFTTARFTPKKQWAARLAHNADSTNREAAGMERPSWLGEQEWLAGHQAPVTAMCWGPEGRNLATASSDGEVRVWAPTCLPTSDASRAAVQGCGAPVSCLAWDARADKVMCAAPFHTLTALGLGHHLVHALTPAAVVKAAAVKVVEL